MDKMKRWLSLLNTDSMNRFIGMVRLIRPILHLYVQDQNRLSCPSGLENILKP